LLVHVCPVGQGLLLSQLLAHVPLLLQNWPFGQDVEVHAVQTPAVQTPVEH
jgi:hypothetical protein